MENLTWLLLFGVLVLPAGCFSFFTPVDTEVALINKTYTGTTRPDGKILIYNYTIGHNDVIRIRVASINATFESPLLAIFRERAAVGSVQLPLTIEGVGYRSTARILCPSLGNRDSSPSPGGDGKLIVHLLLSSYRVVSYEFTATIVEDFFLSSNVPLTSIAAPSEPVYFQYNIPDQVADVIVGVESDSDICMTVSIRTAVCPALDFPGDGSLTHRHQTISRAGAMTVQRKTSDKFFVIFVVHPDDTYCSDTAERMYIETIQNSSSRVKPFTVTAIPSNSPHTSAIVWTTIIFGVIFVLIACGVCIIEKYIGEELTHFANKHALATVSAITSPKSYRYFKGTALIAIFYSIPVVQLVSTWVQGILASGDLDKCWYNYRCAHPWWKFIAFNNMFSNVGYIFFSSLLAFAVLWRAYVHRRLLKKYPGLESYGIERRNDISLAICLAIAMQGALSAAYHVCPTAINFQFDTALMYFLGVLGYLRIYQLRHDDVDSYDQGVFLFASSIVFSAMIGLYHSSLLYWLVIVVVYGFCILCINLHVYLEISIFSIFDALRSQNIGERAPLLNNDRNVVQEEEKGVAPTTNSWLTHIFHFISVISNLMILVHGVITRPSDVPTFLLGPVIFNFVFYLLYYVVSKYHHGESLTFTAKTILIATIEIWIGAVIFFCLHNYSWSETPAMSRQMNHECAVLGYFDMHDMWHFYSAIALFSSFGFIHLMDDDIMMKRRSDILKNARF